MKHIPRKLKTEILNREDSSMPIPFGWLLLLDEKFPDSCERGEVFSAFLKEAVYKDFRINYNDFCSFLENFQVKV